MDLKTNNKIKFRSDNLILTGYIIFDYKNGNYHVAETEMANRDGFTKNWIVPEKDIIEVI